MKKCKLGEIADFKTGPFGTQFKASEYTSSGYPVINVKNIGIGNIIDNDIDFISEETRARLSEHIIHEGDIVFARKGSVERHAYVRKEHDGWVQGSDCIKAKITDDTDPRYVSYFLHLDYVKQQLLNKAVGSTMPSMNTDILKDISIALPDKPEDGTTIANFLDKISNKIDNNQRIISTLESLSKTLYGYYFLQFDFPDEKGRPYKSSGGKMEYNAELGREIPAGWKVTTIGKITNNFDSMRIPLSANERREMQGTIPYYGATDVMDYVNRSIFHGQYVLIAEDGSVMGSNNYPFVQMIYGDSWVNNHAHVLQGKNGFSNEHLYLILKGIPVVTIKTGSIQAKINQENLNSYKLALPPSKITNNFDKKIKPWFNAICNAKDENRHLTALRDFLLPLLMNGQVGFKK